MKKLSAAQVLERRSSRRRKQKNLPQPTAPRSGILRPAQ
ncbi:hypothetical protein A2U01_0000826, partial [Trifolium medium]|nr:hypothetical protein [Trifolium medium]